MQQKMTPKTKESLKSPKDNDDDDMIKSAPPKNKLDDNKGAPKVNYLFLFT